MKIAIVDSNNKITNVIVADESYINGERKFLSKDSPLWIDDIYTDELALVENLQKEIDEKNDVVLPPVEPQPQLKEILITEVTNALKKNSTFTHITCYELTSFMVRGSVNIPDQTFSMPLKRDDGRLILFPVDVVNGQFEVLLNFPTSGQYIYTSEQANYDLPTPIFIVNPIKIDALRKIT
ncbi:putative uncharacterized phage protein [Aliivibrio wodanis]|uniref:Uncharacterized phage protein n=1 Tax=Aliivibrio wodanis TaxID=80852 RepID=A0A090IMA9_9GAMM|nr:putative uncharacterized phage protein [Aliivibrio wodanis]